MKSECLQSLLLDIRIIFSCAETLAFWGRSFQWMSKIRDCLRRLQQYSTERTRKKLEKSNLFTWSINSIWIIEGGTLALERDNASSNLMLRVIIFLKCRRANCRTEGSFPLETETTQDGLWAVWKWTSKFLSDFLPPLLRENKNSKPECKAKEP